MQSFGPRDLPKTNRVASMRAKLFLICVTCGLLAGLGWIYVGATSTLPHAWVHLVAGVLMLIFAGGMLWLWSKEPAA